MADINNFTEINENFDTVKTLLNSIRAQGILNTSDVDKLLSGINAKLEKINTEEDIDLIKVFLTELKQNLDERHNVLISKFGAIEALFSNLLKNSTELPKSSELKELFDIVATNLSVFSREVVAQKESLTDITMRLDAIRSDDSQKKDIIKNITLLKPDLERLNNGFDTIVLSLNDNFRTLAKTITSIDKTEHLDKFADTLGNIEMSSNALLSAIQLLDKKTEAVDGSLKDLATKDDIEKADKNLAELKLLSQSLNSSVDEINEHYSKIDNLAEKIDASVSIIAGLKTGLENSQEENTKTIIESLEKLETKLQEINNDSEFEEFKNSLTSVLKDITDNTVLLDKNIGSVSESISSVIDRLRALDIHSEMLTIRSSITSSENEIKDHISENIEKFSTLSEANLGKIISNISSSADALSTRLNQTQSEISSICEGSFGTVFENIAELKKIVSQIDENGVSANNAMFSNISDRLNLFETALKESLETQEYSTAEATAKLNEQVENIRNLSNVMDYKMDSSVVEISNMTRMFETLKGSVDSILALNFVDTVKDLRADIYASKQDMNTALENTAGDLSENLTKDIYGKYELLISKLDSVEDEFKKTQTSALNYIKEAMDKISASIVDIISYVSESKEFPVEEIDKKIAGLTATLKETNLNYVESVRDIVDVIRAQVETNLRDIEDESAIRMDKVQSVVETSTEDIKNEIKNSCEKLAEVKQTYEELKEIIGLNNVDNSDKFEKLFSAAGNINSEFDLKLSLLKAELLDRITEFKKEFTCESADKINEFRFTVENLYTKNVHEIMDSVDKIKFQLENISSENSSARNNALDSLLGDLTELKNLIKNISVENTTTRESALDNLLENLADIKTLIQNISSESTNSRANSMESLKTNLAAVETLIQKLASENTASRNNALNSLKSDINAVGTQIQQIASENAVSRNDALEGLKSDINAVGTQIQQIASENTSSRKDALEGLKSDINAVGTQIQQIASENATSRNDALEELKSDINSVSTLMQDLSAKSTDARTAALERIYSDFANLDKSVKDLAYDTAEGRKSGLSSIVEAINDLKEQVTAYSEGNTNNNDNTIAKITETYENVKALMEKYAEDTRSARTNIFAQLLDNFVGLKEYAKMLNNETAENLTQKSNNIIESFESVKSMLSRIDENIDGDLTRQFSIIESNFESLIAQISIVNEKAEQTLIEKINDEYNTISEQIDNNVTQKLEEYKTKIEETFDTLSQKAQSQSSYLQERISDINSVMKTVWIEQSENNIRQIDEISDRLKGILDENIKLAAVDYNALKEKLDDFTRELEANNEILTQNLKAQLDDMTKYVDSVLDIQVQETGARADELIKSIEAASEKLLAGTDSVHALSEEHYNLSKATDEIANKILAKTDEAHAFAEEHLNISKTTDETTRTILTKVDEAHAFAEGHYNLSKATDETANKILAKTDEAHAFAEEHLNISKTTDETTRTILTKVDEAHAFAEEHYNLSKATDETANKILAKTDEAHEFAERHFKLSEEHLNISKTTAEELSALRAETGDTAIHIRTLEESANNLLEQVEAGKQSVLTIKDFISDVLQNRLRDISKEIEQETDAVINELIEQFDLMKRSQQDSVVQITSGIESIISSQVYNNIEDLKSYLDVKTDSSAMTERLDNLKIEITSSFDNVISDLNKMLSTDVFTSAMSDYRIANEILVNSAADRVNEKIGEFMGEFSEEITGLVKDGNQNVESKLALFDKKFVDTVVDKYEEIKLISNKYNTAFEDIKKEINGVLDDFQGVKSDLGNQINNLIDTIQRNANNTNAEIRQLNDCFEHLRSQISNKSFDEAFQASINRQIASLESLIHEQYTHIEDINDLCEINLPDVAELNTLVKGTIIERLHNLSEKIDKIDIRENLEGNFGSVNNLIAETAENLSEQIEAQNVEETIETALKDTKSEIITQFLNIFNQISFVTEQEEILDFIQEKHDELIKVLSHIVTHSSVKADVTAVDKKINSLRDEIGIINDKITSIISSEGDVDYIYSLQDLESDIANLRIVLKEMKDNTDHYGNEFENLMASTEGVYKLVESIKDDLPDKKSFNSLTEDIVSISTRTNKLILASDESYRTLKDNLHDFKLVIDDLDERTRNFAQESGMDKINSKLNALNSMVQSGAKTNQVFNEVFEYLAEWIDNAGTQINAISSKVETLDEIGQIKVMLADLKAESEDNSENVELIEALSNVFDKQAKKISTLETKLDKMIVETTINNQNNKIDMKPMEDTLNKFLAAIGEKLTSQQEKINSLEAAMEKIADILDEKDTAQLTKKVGGMDRQIAKLNKSIEKIASHVIEK